jgi:prepilin-type N-terminal cleavage/methylation domain-containing protein
MKRQSTNPGGFSIVEILIAVIIIGVLASVLVPVLINRSRESRLRVCEQELQSIADAQERAAIDTGYYYRFFVLDDLPGNTGANSIGAEQDNTFFDNPTQIFVDPETNDLLSLTRSAVMYDRITNETDYGWPGPYYTIHRDETFVVGYETEMGHLAGIPNDPWGSDYVFVTREGALAEPAGQFRTMYMGGLTQGFDRPAVVSFGPDGLPGSDGNPQLGRGDDLYRSFGY